MIERKPAAFGDLRGWMQALDGNGFAFYRHGLSRSGHVAPFFAASRGVVKSPSAPAVAGEGYHPAKQSGGEGAGLNAPQEPP